MTGSLERCYSAPTSLPMCVTELDSNLHHLDEPIQPGQEDGRRGRNPQRG
jgi:hypothetical protein